MKNRNKFRPSFVATVTVDLYSNSTEGKFDAFASRITGTNIRLIESRGDVHESGMYTYEVTDAGLPILIDRWNKRLGSGSEDMTVLVQTA
jgi:hypothetical protein